MHYYLVELKSSFMKYIKNNYKQDFGQEIIPIWINPNRNEIKECLKEDVKHSLRFIASFKEKDVIIWPAFIETHFT